MTIKSLSLVGTEKSKGEKIALSNRNFILFCSFACFLLLCMMDWNAIFRLMGRDAGNINRIFFVSFFVFSLFSVGFCFFEIYVSLKSCAKYKQLDIEQCNFYEKLSSIDVKKENLNSWSEYVAFLSKLIKEVQQNGSGLQMWYHEEVMRRIANTLKEEFNISDDVYNMLSTNLNLFQYCFTAEKVERLMILKIRHENWKDEESEIIKLESCN